MNLQLISGKIPSAQKVVIYGPEGIGKSTFAAQFPNPLFIDTEGSTTHMDVTRVPRPKSWQILMDIVREIAINPVFCKTLVIDTADWAEILCSEHICSRAQVKGIEDWGFGKGYTYLAEEFGKLLNLLQDVINSGIHVVLTAHSQMRKFEQPDEMGAYDRWELKLGKKTAALVKEWADMVLFANYKTYVINVDNQGAAKGKNKAQGGERIMHTSHHACWDAKNRHGLPDEISFNYSSISHLFNASVPDVISAVQQPVKAPVSVPDPVIVPDPVLAAPYVPPIKQPKPQPKVPTALLDLMTANDVTIEDIQNVVAQRGYYPANTPIENYDIEFINGSLIGAWPAVLKMINENKLPFVM